MADIVARFRVVGSERMRAALRGQTDDVRKAEKAKRDEAAKTKRETEKAARDQQRAVGQALRDGFRTLREIEQDKRDEIKKTEREAIKSAESQKRAVGRAMRDAFAEMRRISAQHDRDQQRAQRSAQGSGRQRIGMAMGAIGIGAGLAASTIGRAQGALGIRSPDEIMQEAQANRTTFFRQSVAAGQTREQRAAAEAEIARISRENMIDPGTLYGAAASSQERFSDMGSLMAHLSELARISQRTGTSMEDLQGNLGELRQTFRISDRDLDEAMNRMVAATDLGSVGFDKLSQVAARSMGTYAAARGANGTGQAALMDFVAAQETIASGTGGNADIAATRFENLMGSLSDRQTQGRLRAAGVNVLDSTGHMRSIQDITASARGSQLFSDPRKLANAVRDRQARDALITLMGAEGTNHSIGTIAGASAANARATTDRYMAEYRSSGLGQNAAMANDRTVSVYENFDSMSSAARMAAGAATELGNKFPILTGMAGDLAGALQSAAQAAIGFSAMQGVTGAVGGAGAVGGLGGLGALGGAVGGAGAGTIAGVIAAGGALGGAIGTGANWLGGKISEWTGGDGSTLSDIIGEQGSNRFNEVNNSDWGGGGSRRGGGAGGTQQVTGTIELGPNTVSRITATQQPAPGQGRRQPGGPAGR